MSSSQIQELQKQAQQNLSHVDEHLTSSQRELHAFSDRTSVRLDLINTETRENLAYTRKLMEMGHEMSVSRQSSPGNFLSVGSTHLVSQGHPWVALGNSSHVLHRKVDLPLSQRLESRQVLSRKLVMSS